MFINNAPNEVIRGEGYYVSYNPGPWLGESDETALVKDDKFYILNGDWRKEYKEVNGKGFDKAYEIFMGNLDKKSFWSNDPL